MVVDNKNAPLNANNRRKRFWYFVSPTNTKKAPNATERKGRAIFIFVILR